MPAHRATDRAILPLISIIIIIIIMTMIMMIMIIMIMIMIIIMMMIIMMMMIAIMITTTTTTTTTTTMLIALEGGFRDFYDLLTAQRTVSNTYAQVARARSCAKSRATHRARITCNSCYMPRGTKGQLTYDVWQSKNLIYFSFILLAEPLTKRL